MGPFGVQEMILICILALLLFGPKKLPELARLLGKGLTEFRRAKNELTSTLNTHMRELEREVQAAEAKKNPPPAAAPAYNPYAYMADEYGKVPSDYSYNGSPSEPPVQSHAEPASAPAGAVPRSPSASVEPESAQVHEEKRA